MPLIESICVAYEWIEWIAFVLTMTFLWSLIAIIVIGSLCAGFFELRDHYKGVPKSKPKDTRKVASGIRTSMAKMTEREILEMVRAGVEQLQVRRVKDPKDKDVEKVGESEKVGEPGKSLDGNGKEEEWLLM